MRLARPPTEAQAARRDVPDPTHLDDLFLDAIDAVVLDVLARIGDDPEARFAVFRRLLEVAEEAVAQDEAGGKYLS